MAGGKKEGPHVLFFLGQPWLPLSAAHSLHGGSLRPASLLSDDVHPLTFQRLKDKYNLIPSLLSFRAKSFFSAPFFSCLFLALLSLRLSRLPQRFRLNSATGQQTCYGFQIYAGALGGGSAISSFSLVLSAVSLSLCLCTAVVASAADRHRLD